MSEAVKNLFTNISPTYDRLNHFLSFNFDKSWRRKTIANISFGHDAKFLALDVCCGTHDLGLECLRQFPNASITGIDFSQGMLDAGEGKIAAEKRSGKITPVCGDALAMPFPDESFDVIFCAYGVRNFDDTTAGLNEMRRVLKPGGQLLVLEFFRPTSVLNRFFNKTYGEYVLPRLGARVSGHPSAYAYLRDSIRGFLSAEEIAAKLGSIGFERIATRDFFLSISTSVSAFKK